MKDFISYTIFFDLSSFQRLGQKSWKKSLVFWEIWRHQKDILKLTDLYVNVKSESVIFFKYVDYYWPSPKNLFTFRHACKGRGTLFHHPPHDFCLALFEHTGLPPRALTKKKSKKPLSFFDTWRDGHANLNTRTKVNLYKSCRY